RSERRVVSFRNVSVGEPAGPDLSGQCGGLPARRASRSERAKLPHGYVAEKTNPRASASGPEGLRPGGN
ncbi:MAG: hypothetical protein R6T98_01735, partial [Desulfatiglandales bacterium]